MQSFASDIATLMMGAGATLQVGVTFLSIQLTFLSIQLTFLSIKRCR
jgi:hypothetical protein